MEKHEPKQDHPQCPLSRSFNRVTKKTQTQVTKLRSTMVLNPESEWEILSAQDIDSSSESGEVNAAATTEDGERQALLVGSPNTATNTAEQASPDDGMPPAETATIDDPPVSTITLFAAAPGEAEGQGMTTGSIGEAEPSIASTATSVENSVDCDDDTSNDEAIARALQDQEDQKGQQQQDGVRKIKNIFGAVSRFMGEIDDKHKISRKTRNSVKTVGASVNAGAQKVGESARVVERKTINSVKTVGASVNAGAQKVGESARALETAIDDKTKQIHEAYVQSNIEQKAKESVETVKDAVTSAGATAKEAAISAGATAKETATSVGQSALRFNEDYKVTEKLTAAAVVGSAVLLAKGNIRAGAAVLAAGGAAYMAHEATVNTTAPYRQNYDSGLGNEHMHMD